MSDKLIGEMNKDELEALAKDCKQMLLDKGFKFKKVKYTRKKGIWK